MASIEDLERKIEILEQVIYEQNEDLDQAQAIINELQEMYQKLLSEKTGRKY
jgi:prefoldin subunit 5